MRQLSVHRVHHDAKCRKGKIVGGSDLRRDMGFHIGGMRPCFQMQGVFFLMVCQRRIDPGDIGGHGPAEGMGKPLRPNRIAVIAGPVFGDNPACDKLHARRNSRDQAARDAKTEDCRGLARDGRFQSSGESRGVSAARDRMDARPGDNSRFRLKAGDGDDPQADHMLTSTGYRLLHLRLR